MPMTRKDFLKTTLALAGAGIGLGFASGCSDDDDPPPKQDTTTADKGPLPDTTLPDTSGSDTGGSDTGGGSTCTSKGTNTEITTNHGHALTVPKADVVAGVEKTYDIKGSSPHLHTVKVTAADFTRLQAGTAVTITSSTDAAHSHDAKVSCQA